MTQDVALCDQVVLLDFDISRIIMYSYITVNYVYVEKGEIMFSVTVGEHTFVVDRVTPSQVSAILRIVSRVNLKARKTLAAIEDVNDADYIWAFLGSLEENDLVELAAAAIGCDKKFAEENFDLRWVAAAVGALLKHVDIAGVVANFTSALVPTES